MWQKLRPAPARLWRCLERLRAEDSGATAVEFGMVAAPFFMLIMMIMVIGLQFFTAHSLENGVATAARQIRTGQAQKAGKTLAQFRQMVCDEAGSFIKCTSKLVIHVKSGTVFADLDPPTSCVTNGNLTPSSGSGTDALATSAGTASSTVLIIACYESDLGGSLWQIVHKLLTSSPGGSTTAPAPGKSIIQATTSFRTEPYI
jgi:Flp pilus assembly protein TadG